MLSVSVSVSVWSFIGSLSGSSIGLSSISSKTGWTTSLSVLHWGTGSCSKSWPAVCGGGIGSTRVSEKSIWEDGVEDNDEDDSDSWVNICEFSDWDGSSSGGCLI